MNDAPLKYPEADAAAVADLLKQSGYTIDLLLGEQATQQAVADALQRAGQRGNADGVVLIGLFGHGVQYGEDAYFAPYDTSIRDVVDSQGNVLRKGGKVLLEPDPASMVSMKSLLDALERSGAGNRVILADCCREDPSTARGRAFGSQLRVADLPPGTAALFACSAKEQAFEHDDWGHGAFTFAFLEECRRLSESGRVRANVVSTGVYDRVKDLVSAKTNGRSRQTVNPLINGVIDLRLLSGGDGTLLGSKAGEVREFAGDLKVKFCWCPPGEFNFRAERRVGLRHAEASLPPLKITPASNSVRLTQGFWLSMYEVSVSEFLSVLPQYRSQKLAVEPDGNLPKSGDLESLAAEANWREAVEFCRELTLRERLDGRLNPSEEYVLPTVAQWQFAMQAGAETQFFFGDRLSQSEEYCVPWSSKNFRGMKKPNHWGLYDLVGGQLEWCQDWLPGAEWPGGDDPRVPLRHAYTREWNNVEHRYHVLAGGYYDSSAGSSNVLNDEMRGVVFEGGTEDCPYYGFRIARTRVR